jgi:hypothetical protein
VIKKLAPRPPLETKNTQQAQYLSYFQKNCKNQDNNTCPTNEKQIFQKYLDTLGNKYLYKRGKIYYFSKRINGKVRKTNNIL